jgi:nucleotide-binding universal stress UspA family protein
MILIAYDGSKDAQAAIDHVGDVLPGAEATVLAVWEPLRKYDGGLGFGMSMAGVYAPEPEVDGAREAEALAAATAGAERANAAGLTATPRAAQQHDGIARTILAVAAELDAGVVVVGTRGLGGVKSFLLGSTADALLQQADRPVLVVPSRPLAARRRDAVQRAEAEEA